MKLNVYTQKGNKSQKQAEVSEKVFASYVNEEIMSKYVYVYLANQREAIAHTKDRSERRGGGAKPWRQKGTGNARAGSNRSPIWKGGGITFGPTREVNWKKSMNKKERKSALRSALTVLNTSENLQVVDKIELKDEKLTKQANEFVKAFGNPKKMTIVVPDKDEKLLKAFNNIPRVYVVTVGELNAYSAMTAGKIIFLLESLEYTYKWE